MRPQQLPRLPPPSSPLPRALPHSEPKSAGPALFPPLTRVLPLTQGSRLSASTPLRPKSPGAQPLLPQAQESTPQALLHTLTRTTATSLWSWSPVSSPCPSSGSKDYPPAPVAYWGLLQALLAGMLGGTGGSHGWDGTQESFLLPSLPCSPSLSLPVAQG